MRFDIYAGAQFKKDGSQLMPHEVQQATRRFISDASAIFGGVTMTAVNGGYHSPHTGKLVLEPSVHMTIIAPESKLELVRNLARGLKDDLSQESVLISETESTDYSV